MTCESEDDRGINGGLMHLHRIRLNWYLNDDAKFQFRYDPIHHDVPSRR